MRDKIVPLVIGILLAVVSSYMIGIYMKQQKRYLAEEARQAGEKAANEAARVAAQAIVRVEETAKRALRMAELVSLAVTDAAASAQKRLSEHKEFSGESKKG